MLFPILKCPDVLGLCGNPYYTGGCFQRYTSIITEDWRVRGSLTTILEASFLRYTFIGVSFEVMGLRFAWLPWGHWHVTHTGLSKGLPCRILHVHASKGHLRPRHVRAPWQCRCSGSHGKVVLGVSSVGDLLRLCTHSSWRVLDTEDPLADSLRASSRAVSPCLWCAPSHPQGLIRPGAL
jgi:hypothetical protein